jgi:hypothetical protein
MVNRTPHGAERHADAGRPASEAASDKAASNEIYQVASTLEIKFSDGSPVS